MDEQIMKDLEEFEEVKEDQQEQQVEDQYETQQELMEGYPVPEPDEKQNAHTFLHKAAFDSPDTVRTTFLFPEELGRPLFSVRFMLKMQDVAKYYLDPLLIHLKLDPLINNRIATYFWEDVQNVTSSGMSNKGFAMNLNVTRKVDATKKKVRQTSELKGGKTKNEP